MPLIILLVLAIGIFVFLVLPRKQAARRNADLVEAPKVGKDLVVRLLQDGADIDAADRNGYTALIIAASIDAFEIVGLLLENEAKVNQATLLGVTPLMAACKAASPKIARLLLERGAGVNLRDHMGKTALGYSHDAVRHQGVREVLSSYGALE